MNTWLTVEAPVLEVHKDLPLRSGHTWSQIILADGGECICINCWDNGGVLPDWVQPGARARVDVHVRSQRSDSGRYYTTCSAGSIEPVPVSAPASPPAPTRVSAQTPVHEEYPPAHAGSQGIPAAARPGWADFRQQTLAAAGFKL